MGKKNHRHTHFRRFIKGPEIQNLLILRSCCCAIVRHPVSISTPKVQASSLNRTTRLYSRKVKVQLKPITVQINFSTKLVTIRFVLNLRFAISTFCRRIIFFFTQSGRRFFFFHTHCFIHVSCPSIVSKIVCGNRITRMDCTKRKT